MSLDGKLAKNYAANEKTFNSSTIDPDEKAAAWRQQAITLVHLTRNSTIDDSTRVLKYHIGKYKDHGEFIDRRANAVDALFKNLPSNTSSDINDVLLELDSSLFEPIECRGKYESCRHNEISQDDLNKLQTSLAGRHTVKSFSSSVSEEKLHGNDISKYFQKQPANNSITVPESTKPTTATKRPAERNVNATSSLLAESNFFSSKDSAQRKKQTDGATAVGTYFRTAREELVLQSLKKYGHTGGNNSSSANSATLSKPLFSYGATKKSLGARRNVRSGFVSPISKEDSAAGTSASFRPLSTTDSPSSTPPENESDDERLVNIDPKMIELITNEIMHKHKPIDWSDIAGLEYAKSTIKEAVVWPLLRPDIFTGLRRPPRGILLFGPPGTGKTLIGKCIASQSKSTFFSISASSLTSKWIGDGEKMVRALFAVAAVHQPSVVFIDEIDSLLSQRSETEHESSRRLKTEFLVQLDGAATSDEDRILIVGATNRPQELDEAARRRLVRRLYIPLPELEARIQILANLLLKVRNCIDNEQIFEIGSLTNGYSGADMETLCREASMEPIRSIPPDEIPFFKEDKVRPVNLNDFRLALQRVRASVSPQDLKQYTDWNRIYGAGH